MTDDLFQHWNTYHKINGPFKRYTDGPTKGRFIVDEWSQPEFAYLADNTWVWTEKVDGTNVRIGVVRDMDGNATSHVGGKTTNAQLHPDLAYTLEGYASLIRDWTMDTWDSPGEMIFYGEGYGPKIQAGGNYRDDIDVIFFDIRANRWWMARDQVDGICGSIGLETVPVFPMETLSGMMDCVGWAQEHNTAWLNSRASARREQDDPGRGLCGGACVPSDDS